MFVVVDHRNVICISKTLEANIPEKKCDNMEPVFALVHMNLSMFQGFRAKQDRICGNLQDEIYQCQGSHDYLD